MKLNLSKYNKQIKILSVIPVLVGLLTFAEVFLPNKNIPTTVVSKNESYRAKFDRTTYNVYFESNNDQFTEDIFNALEIGDKVILRTSYFHEETSEITKVKSGKTYLNDTGEVYIQYIFALIFLIPALAWFKKHSISNKQAKYLIFIILFSLIDFYRIL
ncbi:hypothetical protein [uncultured Algibacter sp.]|uniref:hypothetical protein n=1 Tax=uncultured Algibacter sp. TaxID=298659 RepID=UPI00260D7F4F|nr:hypothetical protein [uncultured Algibacter sp.]